MSIDNGVVGLRSTPVYLEPGTRVVIFTPENPRLHGTEGTVKEVYHWGAKMYAPAAATEEFRALWEEMRPPPATVNYSEPTDLRDQGYTGDICDKCGSGRVLRSGPCLKCVNCGEAGGCG